jgi:hypothetical protein
MARTITEIQNEILGYKEAREELDVLNSGSSTAIWRAWVYITAIAIRTVEVLFDTHKAEVQVLLDTLRPHKAIWYRNKCLAFQYGKDLTADTDTYDNTGLTEAEIEAMKVVKYAAASAPGSKILIKVAGETDGEKAPLTAPQETALLAYLDEVRDAWADLEVTNQAADYFRATIDIYYDPMILDGEGHRLDGTVEEPVQDAVKNYISNLPFNGEYTNMALIDALQAVEGVVIPELKSAESKYGLYDWSIINAKVTPDSGYLKIYDEADLTLTFIPYGATD